MKIVALVVTYNRLSLLKKSIARLLSQKAPLHGILVFNNSSTDGTAEYLNNLSEPLVQVHHHPTNIGGAGGYHEGMKLAMEMQPDWIWCVEDDIIVPRDFSAKAQPFLAAAKLSNSGFVFPKLICIYEPRKVQRPQPNELGPNNTLERAVFAGCLINSSAIAACGYPIKKYFIHFDDWEYTSRLTRMGFAGLHVPDLYLWHYDASKPMQNVHLTITSDQLWKSLYGIRNELSYYKANYPWRYPKLLIKHCMYVPFKILIFRPNQKLNSAIRWFWWSLKSLWF